MAHGFNISTIIKSILDKVLQVNLPLILYTNLKSLYDCLVRLKTTEEKRLMIDIIYISKLFMPPNITDRFLIAPVRAVRSSRRHSHSVFCQEPIRSLYVAWTIKNFTTFRTSRTSRTSRTISTISIIKIINIIKIKF